MTFLLDLDTARFPKECRSCVKCVFQELVKCPRIPEVKLKLYARANMFDVINGLGVFQND